MLGLIFYILKTSAIFYNFFFIIQYIFYILKKYINTVRNPKMKQFFVKFSIAQQKIIIFQKFFHNIPVLVTNINIKNLKFENR